MYVSILIGIECVIAAGEGNKGHQTDVYEEEPTYLYK
jgi:hypothetical protein